MKRQQHKLMTLFVVLLLALAPALVVDAQGTTATPDSAGLPTGTLAEFQIDSLPSPHAEVWFMRYELAPGGRIPAGANPGPTIIYVETGTLAIEAEGTVVPADSDPVDATAGEAILLEGGDSLQVPGGTSLAAGNTTDEPAVFLMLVMYSAMDEGQSEQSNEEPTGMTTTGISIGIAEFESVPGTLVMERVVVEPGESLQNVEAPGEEVGPGWGGIDLGTVETGSADLLIEQASFQNMVWPPMMPDQFAEPEQALLTANLSLEQGEGYTAFNSVLTFTNTGDEPLTILRVIVTPEMGP